MTSDAKIGLLLGLVFIFIIAFIINGLPKFGHTQNSNELTTNMASSRDGLGIAARERAATEAINRLQSPKSGIEFEPAVRTPLAERVRFEMPVPGEQSAADAEVMESLWTEPEVIEVDAPATPVPAAKPRVARSYVVGEGDTLSNIAKKFYGPEAGNKIRNVERIYNANRKLLRSPDELYVGQKLIIPPLAGPGSGRTDPGDVLAGGMFEGAESVGKRRAAASRGTGGTRYYVVREGDSLWEIAAEQLGDGGRYTDITGLNKGILNDENHITPGMRLKIPAR
jgi:nucleoid-associated protein YgaU